MNALLFDPPLYLIVGLLLAGGVLAYTGASRLLAGMKWAGLAAVGLAVLWYAAGRFVETGPEKVTRLTADFVAAADRRDWKTFAGLLDPNVRFYDYGNREDLLAGAKLTMDRVGVKNITTTSYDVASEPGGFTVAFTATVDIDLGGRRLPTNWKFFWAGASTPDGYQIYRIDPLPNPQFGTDPITERLAKPR